MRVARPDPSATRALVPGASKGVGAAIACRLGAMGHAVIVNYNRDTDGANAVVDKIVTAGGEAVSAQFDVGDREATAIALQRLLDDSRSIGVLVNNAGIVRDAGFPMMKMDEWEAVLRAEAGTIALDRGEGRGYRADLVTGARE